MAPAETQTGNFVVTTFVRLRWWLVFFLGGAALLWAAFSLDAEVQSWMTLHQAPAVRSFMQAVSRWGDWPSHIVLGLVSMGVAYARRKRRWARIFLAMIVACALAGAVGRVIKIAAGRSRPSVELDAGWSGPRFGSKYHAFPSGHTYSSTAFFATLALANWRAGLALLPIPLLIAFSRMSVGAHHFSDVVAGVILGALCAFFVWRWLVLPIPNPQGPIGN
jgi:undecaprenyl-diphosphatase